MNEFSHELIHYLSLVFQKATGKALDHDGRSELNSAFEAAERRIARIEERQDAIEAALGEMADPVRDGWIGKDGRP